jgi:O-antigen/teichoic acid export membrane protein
MTSGRLLTRNAIYSIIGQVVPMLAAFAAIRLLISGLGDVRFGVLMLCWAAAGYFAIFDFGLARSMTHAVAGRLASESTDDLGEVVWGGLITMLALGVVGMVVVLAATPLIVDLIDVRSSPALSGAPLGDVLALEEECRRAFLMIALSIPWMVCTGGLRGLLEAHQRFGVSTLLRIPLALTAFVGPIIVLRFTNRLEPIILLLVGGRVLVWALHLIVCLREYPFLRQNVAIRWQVVRSLAHFGGWTTVTNVTAPFMTQLDRFAVAGLLAVDVTTSYVPPFELATKLWIIPVAVTNVLFPSFTSTFAVDRGRAVDLVDSGLRALSVMLFPLTVILVAFAPEILSLWLGNTQGAVLGVPVLRWLAAGAFVIGVGHVLPCALQGAGRPDLIAKLQLVEVPLFWLGLWWLTKQFGLPGVAIASATRMLVDTAILHLILPSTVAGSGPVLVRSATRLAALLVVIGLTALPESLVIRSATAIIALTGFGMYAWMVLIPSNERATLARSLGLSGAA